MENNKDNKEKKETNEKKEVIGWIVKDGCIKVTLSLKNVWQANWICQDIQQYLRDLVQTSNLQKQAEKNDIKARIEGKDSMGKGLNSNPNFLKGKMK